MIDDWTAEELRGAGLRLARHVIVRRQLAGRSSYPDPIDDMIDEVLGFVALFMGGVTFHAFRRARPRLTLS